MRKYSQLNRGFTLIELLTVIAIIGVLAGLLFPAISAAMKKAKGAKAHTEVHAIETAWKSYFNEYGHWPVDASTKCLGQDATETLATPGIQTKNDIAALLLGSTATGIGNYVPTDPSQNPKHIQFLNLKADPTTGQFLDPWNHPYVFLFDVDYDNQIKNNVLTPTFPNTIPRTVIVWSLGPDGVFNTSDDIRSW